MRYDFGRGLSTELFRGYMQRLDPAATGTRDELYVEPPSRAVGEQLATRLQLAPTSSHLVIGTVGGGKSTQLLRATELLRSTSDTHAVYVDVSRRHDLDKDLEGVLIVLAGLELARLLKDHDDPSVKTACEHFKRWAYGHSEFIPYDPRDDEEPDWNDREPGRFIDHPGVLSRPHHPMATPPTHIQAHIIALKTLRAALPSSTQHFIVLLDSLDRLESVDAFRRAFAEDVRALKQAQIGLAIVGPSGVLYGPNRSIVDIFDQLHRVPALDVRTPQEREFLEQVLAKRVDDGVVDARARGELVRWSGGILRDLLELTRGAVEEAFLNGADSVSDAHIKRSVDAFGRTLMLGLRATELGKLQWLRHHGAFIPTTDDDLALLVSRRVIEYPGFPKPYSVHPTIKPLLTALEANR